jgi:SAM-dependent methyltransferase
MITADERARLSFRRWIDCLLDPTRTPGEHRHAAYEWCEWGLALLDIDENDVSRTAEPFFADTVLGDGKAISPLGAARCVREYRRTAVFLQAMDAALREAFERFPGETIHVLEAGCGPLAPLALPFALRFPEERVVFTLLDLHPVAIEGARRVVKTLGLQKSIRNYLVADAITLRFADADRPHVIACEVLLRALVREPQVAVTLNLAPQLRPGGIFLPQRIDVDAALFDASRHFAMAQSSSKASDPPEESPAIIELGNVFSLAAEHADRVKRDESGRLRANTIAVPPHDPRRTPLQLLTRIQVFNEHRLGDFDCSLNLPERVSYPRMIAERGGDLGFDYEISFDPGLRVRDTIVDPTTPISPAALPDVLH